MHIYRCSGLTFTLSSQNRSVGRDSLQYRNGELPRKSESARREILGKGERGRCGISAAWSALLKSSPRKTDGRLKNMPNDFLNCSIKNEKQYSLIRSS